MATNFAASSVGLEPVEGVGRLHYGIDIDDHLAAFNPALQKAKTFMADTRNIVDGMNKRRATVNEEITAKKNLADIAREADLITEKVSRGYTQTEADLISGKVQAEAAVDAKVALKVTPNASEIRSVFRSMSEAERSEALLAAFDNNDHEVMAALVNVPTLLHGCNADQLAARYDLFKRRVAYGEYRVLDEYNKAIRYLDDCHPGLLRWQADIYKGTTFHTEKQAKAKALMNSYGFKFGDDD